MATMLELGRRYGGLAFTCERDFEVLGDWVRDAPEPAWQMRFADHCHRFAFHADRLRWLVPEIEGLTVGSQLRPLAEIVPLGASDGRVATGGRVAALVGQWRTLAGEYDRLLDGANPVSDGPAVRWVRLLAHDAGDAIADLERSA